MNYRYKELGFPSGDGKSTIHAEVYEPVSGRARGIFQICHGMIDCVERYKFLVDYLTGLGFIVCGADHLGHVVIAMHKFKFKIRLIEVFDVIKALDVGIR